MFAKSVLRWFSLVFCAGACLAVLSSPSCAANLEVWDIPYLHGIIVDGKTTDWGDRGFRVNIMEAQYGRLRSAADFRPSFRLGWNEEGLVVLAEIRHIGILGPGTAMHLCISAKQKRLDYEASVSFDGDPKRPKMTWETRNLNGNDSAKFSAKVEYSALEGGYVVEALLPWKDLDMEPSKGTIVYFMMCTDDDTSSYGDTLRAYWALDPKWGINPRGNAVRLASKASAAVSALYDTEYESAKRLKVSVRTITELSGRTVTVRDGRHAVAEAVISRDADGWGSATLRLPLPPVGKDFGTLTARICDGVDGRIILNKSACAARASTLLHADLRSTPCVFSGEQFPIFDFHNRELIENAIGPYTVSTKFYDQDYKLVTKADKPGRYGAVIEIKPEQGSVMKRFRTLFRQPGNFDWVAHYSRSGGGEIVLPKEMGIDPAVVKEQSRIINGVLGNLNEEDERSDNFGAVIAAGLYETKPGSEPASVYDDVFARDRQWWVGLKRRLYGMDTVFSKPILSPRTVQGTPATVLHDGTLQEAGMKPDTVEKIDKYCTTWAKESDQGFAVLIARHGVVVLHRAYGTRNGRPMTVSDRSSMASITKLMGSTLLMQLVDQGLVQIDDRVDKYLPALRGIQVEKPMTIRNLCTHTAGFDYMDHWGDAMSDLDEVVAGFYPFLHVGERFDYNGVGYSLVGKITEMVSGECIPAFYKHHLLDPLGMEHTIVTGTYGDAASTPMDIGRMAQMLLNKGAYGDKRFFSEETFRKMLPVRVDMLLGPDTRVAWGIGLQDCIGEGLSPGTVGHGASSSAIIRIDHVDDLIIVQTRNGISGNDSKYIWKFVPLVAECLVRPAKH